jgi:hypothetical protein
MGIGRVSPDYWCRARSEAAQSPSPGAEVKNMQSYIPVRRYASFYLYLVMNEIYISNVVKGPPLWSSGQSSWLQIPRSWVLFLHYYQILWELVGLERGPLSLVSTTEEQVGRNSSGSCLENREYGRGDPLHWPRDTLYPQKLALTSPTSGGRTVGIVRSRTKATKLR